MATQFNEQQQQAITSRAKKILVAAGAGSGKSTVLVERLMRKILFEQINVDNFLIVTFTNLAAKEMLEKLRIRIDGAINEFPNNQHLKNQLYKLPYAHISTFHGFCNKLLMRYYYLVGIDANMRLMDDVEATMMCFEEMEKFMDSMYDNEIFTVLLDVFSNDRSDEPLKVLLIKIYEIARANPDMDDWLSNFGLLYEIKGTSIDGWVHYKLFLSLIYPLLDAAHEAINDAVEIAKSAGSGSVSHGYIEASEVDKKFVAALKEMLDSGDYESVRNMLIHTKIPPFPPRSSKLAKEHWDEELHKEASVVRNKYKDIIQLLEGTFFAYTNDSHMQHLSRGKDVVYALSVVLKMFHEQFMLEKITSSKLDFSDLERLTLDILTQNPSILEEIAKEFDEIMIDEYQDTNDMQERIVTMISTANDVSMFMVGDVKQSIYRFRLADPTIFQNKYMSFKLDNSAGEKIDLMQNYRSSEQVIDATNYIFDAIMDEEVGEISYDEDAQLKLGMTAEGADEFNTPEVYVIDKEAVTSDDKELEILHNAQLEAHFIGKKITEMMDERVKIYDRKKGMHRNVNYDDIVILLRSATAAKDMYEILTKYDIPVSIESTGNLLEETEIITVLSLLKIIDNPYQDIPLVATLRSPLFVFTEPELAQIRIQVSSTSFYESLKLFASTVQTNALVLKVQDFLLRLSNFRYQSKLISLANLLQLIYEETSYYTFVLGMSGSKLRQMNLDLLQSHAKDYETRYMRGVYGFLSYIDQLEKLEKKIPRAKVLSDATGVKIMTIHKSKGLEFPVVFVASLNKTFNTSDEIGNEVIHKNYGVGVVYVDPALRLRQKTIAMTVLTRKLRSEMLAEEMRLLYVALTRSKSKLILTGVLKNAEKIEELARCNAKPSHYRLGAKCYLDWILPVICNNDSLNPWNFEIISDLFVASSASDVSREGYVSRRDVDFGAAFFKKYPLEVLTTITAKQSVTQRKVEETVPLYQGIPERLENPLYDRPSFIDDSIVATEIGTVLHQFMQHLSFEDLHTLQSLELLRDELLKRNVLKKQLADVVDLESILRFTQSKMYQELLCAKEIHKELPFTMLFDAHEITVAKAMLQGVIDLLVEFDNEVWIVDYKTDRVRNFSNEESLLRARYSVQMKYYMQAIRGIFTTKNVIAKVYFMSVGEVITYE